MPIFHEPDETQPPRQSALPSTTPHHHERAGKPGNGFERPLLDPRPASPSLPSVSAQDVEIQYPSLLDRLELIERLKRVSSPTQLHVSPTASPGPRKAGCGPYICTIADLPLQHGHRDGASDSRPSSQDRPNTPLLSPFRQRTSQPCTPDPLGHHASMGLEIARPRSALHSGDFSEKKEGWSQDNDGAHAALPLATSPVAPWHHSFPAAAPSPSRAEPSSQYQEEYWTSEHPSVNRVRAASQSSLSSFALLPPTSPLVQQSNNTDLDFSTRPSSRQSSTSPERGSRRHTFSPSSFETFRSSNLALSASGTPAARHIRKATATPYQAHQPRRSLSSFYQSQPHSIPQSPLLGSRRPSLSSEASPLHHAPMVGSYEESILRGRMSTTPSKPLNFIAKIGVLGRGNCKSNLRCPPHVAVPFPAVFYSYNSGNGRISDDSPSPYVGLIDLENSIVPPEQPAETSKRKRRQVVPDPGYDDLGTQMEDDAQILERKTQKDLRRKEKKKRRSTSPKAPPGGSYRIPQQGQLQIVIKNPNKTAVKLFLVPYDLSDMEPGQKTFIRQRSYSAGPIIDMPLSNRKNLGTDRPEASLSSSDDPNERPILRYLIHLHICCPSKGRFYLYKSIRVVFANRVPDGKEKLRNEIQMPEPRYSTYKASRDSLASQVSSSAAAQLASDKAFRRRSAGLSLSQHMYNTTDGSTTRHRPQPPPPAVRFTGSPSHADFRSLTSGINPIPFALSRKPLDPTQPVTQDLMDVDLVHSLRPHDRSCHTPPPTLAEQTPQNSRSDAASFEKLNHGDVGYGGNAFSGVTTSPVSPGTGILARQLRGLDVEPDEHTF